MHTNSFRFFFFISNNTKSITLFFFFEGGWGNPIPASRVQKKVASQLQNRDLSLPSTALTLAAQKKVANNMNGAIGVQYNWINRISYFSHH